SLGLGAQPGYRQDIDQDIDQNIGQAANQDRQLIPAVAAGIAARKPYIEPVVIGFGVATWPFVRAIWQTGWQPAVGRMTAICARPSHCRATRRGPRRAISSAAIPRRPI